MKNLIKLALIFIFSSIVACTSTKRCHMAISTHEDIHSNHHNSTVKRNITEENQLITPDNDSSPLQLTKDEVGRISW